MPGDRTQGRAAVTRENKLALIVGFSVILVVGVLVSDHFSKARQDQLREINDEEIGSVGVERSRGFTPIEPLVSDEATPIATRPETTNRSTSAPPPWHGPRSTNRGLLGGALDARNSETQRSTPRQAPQSSEVASSEREQRPLHESPLLIQQGQPTPIASRDTSTNGFNRLIDRGTLIPLTQPTSVATGSPRTVSEPLPQTPEAWEYHVRKNDSLYSIAQEHLGSGRRWQEIRDLNKDRLPNDSVLRIGLRLRMPTDAKRPDQINSTPPRRLADTKTPAKSPEKKTGTREYTIESGDTLGQISQRLLGTVKRMDEILKLNADQISDANEIRQGMTLKIPAS